MASAVTWGCQWRLRKPLGGVPRQTVVQHIVQGYRFILGDRQDKLADVRRSPAGYQMTLAS